MILLFDSVFSAVALSHLSVDLINGQRAVLLTFLSVPLGLSNAELGLVSTVYIVAASLMQPVFGYLTDRIGPRWVISGGVLWMAVFFSLSVLTHGISALVLLVLASIGSGAFHPAGTMQATLRGRTHFQGRETTAASLFFLFGQGGLFFGPLLGGYLLDAGGQRALLVLSFFALPVGLFAITRLQGTEIKPEDVRSHTEDKVRTGMQISVMTLIAFAVLAAFQSWAQQNMVTFIPKYLSDLGQSPSTYGAVSAMFMGGSAFGNIFGGNLADRFGKRRVATIALTLAILPLILIPLVGWSPWLYLLIPLAGSFTGATHSIIVVLAQRIIPGGMALASGLILGFMFSSGALGTYLSGYLADSLGLQVVFWLSAGLVLCAALLTRVLAER